MRVTGYLVTVTSLLCLTSLAPAAGVRAWERAIWGGSETARSEAIKEIKAAPAGEAAAIAAALTELIDQEPYRAIIEGFGVDAVPHLLDAAAHPRVNIRMTAVQLCQKHPVQFFNAATKALPKKKPHESRWLAQSIYDIAVASAPNADQAAKLKNSLDNADPDTAVAVAATILLCDPAHANHEQAIATLTKHILCDSASRYTAKATDTWFPNLVDLLQGGDSEQAAAAGMAAAHKGELTDFGKHCLAHADLPVRFWAARGVLLGRAARDHGPALAKVFLETTRSQRQPLQCAVLDALHHGRNNVPPTMATALTEALQADPHDVWVALVVSTIDPNSTTALVALATGSNNGGRVGEICDLYMLEQSRPETLRGALFKVYKSGIVLPSPTLRARAIAAICRNTVHTGATSPSHIVLLRSATKDASAEVRSIAFESLKGCRPYAGQFKTILQAQKDPSPTVRTVAMHGIQWAPAGSKKAKSPPSAVVSAYKNGAKDSDANVRRTAILSFTSLTQSPALAKKALADPSGAVQETAVTALAHLSKATHRKKLARDLFKSRNVALIRAALTSLEDSDQAQLRSDLVDEVTKLSERHPLAEVREQARSLLE
ncbi:MAG: hypothetical protein AAF581_21420 [Planctomycetota bacterium]